MHEVIEEEEARAQHAQKKIFKKMERRQEQQCFISGSNEDGPNQATGYPQLELETIIGISEFTAKSKSLYTNTPTKPNSKKQRNHKTPIFVSTNNKTKMKTPAIKFKITGAFFQMMTLERLLTR